MTFIYQWVIPHQLLIMWLTRACRPILLKSAVFVHQIHLAAYGLLDKGCTQSAMSVFPEVAQNSPENSMSFPCSEKSRSIPGFPDLWPPCPRNTTDIDNFYQCGLWSTQSNQYSILVCVARRQLLNKITCDPDTSHAGLFWVNSEDLGHSFTVTERINCLDGQLQLKSRHEFETVNK